MKIKLKIKRLFGRDGKKPDMPQYKTNGSAAMDIAYFGEEKLKLFPKKRTLVHTGLQAEIPEGYAGFIFARSGMALKDGICLANGVGVIDSDYRGEICIAVNNNSNTVVELMPGDRIAQMLLLPVPHAEIEEVSEISGTDRGIGGFGSTGRQ